MLNKIENHLVTSIGMLFWLQFIFDGVTTPDGLRMLQFITYILIVFILILSAYKLIRIFQRKRLDKQEGTYNIVSNLIFFSGLLIHTVTIFN